jgi:hypothetical protein
MKRIKSVTLRDKPFEGRMVELAEHLWLVSLEHACVVVFASEYGTFTPSS